MVNKTNPDLQLPRLLIQEIMKDKGYTSYSLAQKMGMSQGGLYLRMTSKNPTLSSLQEIADALEVNFLDLFDIPADYHRYQPHTSCGYPIVDNAVPTNTGIEPAESENKEQKVLDPEPDEPANEQTVNTTAFCPHCGSKVRVGVVLMED